MKIQSQGFEVGFFLGYNEVFCLKLFLILLYVRRIKILVFKRP